MPSCEEVLPDIKRTKHLPSIKIIQEEVLKFFKIKNSDLLTKKRKNIPRLFVIYFSKHIALNTYEQIGKVLNTQKTAIGIALIRFQESLKQNAHLRNDLAIMQKRIYERFDDMSLV